MRFRLQAYPHHRSGHLRVAVPTATRRVPQVSRWPRSSDCFSLRLFRQSLWPGLPSYATARGCMGVRRYVMGAVWGGFIPTIPSGRFQAFPMDVPAWRFLGPSRTSERIRTSGRNKNYQKTKDRKGTQKMHSKMCLDWGRDPGSSVPVGASRGEVMDVEVWMRGLSFRHGWAWHRRPLTLPPPSFHT